MRGLWGCGACPRTGVGSLGLRVRGGGGLTTDWKNLNTVLLLACGGLDGSCSPLLRGVDRGQPFCARAGQFGIRPDISGFTAHAQRAKAALQAQDAETGIFAVASALERYLCGCQASSNDLAELGAVVAAFLDTDLNAHPSVEAQLKALTPGVTNGAGWKAVPVEKCLQVAVGGACATGTSLFTGATLGLGGVAGEAGLGSAAAAGIDAAVGGGGGGGSSWPSMTITPKTMLRVLAMSCVVALGACQAAELGLTGVTQHLLDLANRAFKAAEKRGSSSSVPPGLVAALAAHQLASIASSHPHKAFSGLRRWLARGDGLTADSRTLMEASLKVVEPVVTSLPLPADVDLRLYSDLAMMMG